ncbi:phosphatidate cytidylyltransferase [Candidatus Njordibacter sp. Uisw_002]|uniref:phosphatidate cytidylyltransferase n=1 Tax=Candidatus Njordibacter sp. Uisw_002 TaxID=3230971 RepID=UPI003D509CF5|tara:strand:- start:1845 stop:2654 length:810 start_codon:yes stop_codon:yes gene_type:complete
MLKSRIATALVIAPLTLAAVFFLPPQVFSLFIALIVLMAGWEWTAMMRLVSRSQRTVYVLSLLFAIVVVQKALPHFEEVIFSVTAVWWMLATGLVFLYPKASLLWCGRVSKGIVGFMVLVPTWAAMVYIRELEQGPWLILYMFLIVWGADTGAYFAGKRFGKRKLMPRVSPAKSWAGVGGATVTVILISMFTQQSLHFLQNLSAGVYILVLVLLFSSIIGDLTESMFKRQCGIKDSGSILPGHGGIMDRIDSLTAAAPVFALCLILFSA